MNFVVHDVEQRSEAWHALRAGLVTGSAAEAILAVRKKGTGELAIRRDLRNRLVCERLTGLPLDRNSGHTAAMQHGLDVEPDAVAAYEAHTGQIVQRVGFCSHLTLKAGCSPDGYVGAWEGIVEAKCPGCTTHLTYLHGFGKGIPEEYYAQLVHALWLTGASWADFVSYDPRFPPELQIFVTRLERAWVDLAGYELALRLFLDEVDADVAKLQPVAAAVA